MNQQATFSVRAAPSRAVGAGMAGQQKLRVPTLHKMTNCGSDRSTAENSATPKIYNSE